ncbi:MAG: hypothetical protein GY845_36985 [Planctomycetes bacterium]|nr:hypothetical protein [Planctomycetota bacterium]
MHRSPLVVVLVNASTRAGEACLAQQATVVDAPQIMESEALPSMKSR